MATNRQYTINEAEYNKADEETRKLLTENEDIIFTKVGLKNLLSLDPTKIKNIESASADDLNTWNNNANVTAANQVIPGKGLKVIYGDNYYKCVPTGSDIKFPSVGDSSGTAYDNDFDPTTAIPGTLTVVIDGKRFDAPINGLNGTENGSGNDNLTIGTIADPCNLTITGKLNLGNTITITDATEATRTINNTQDPSTGVYGTEDETSTVLTGSITTQGGIAAGKSIKGYKIYGAVFNDYAEYRKSNNVMPGQCVIEIGNGELILAGDRLLPGGNIVSDTFGFGIGQTQICDTPIAVSGRVLAYPMEDKSEYKAGDAVCSGKNGTVSKMTREEIREWPDRIIGYVSEIPEYEYWGSENVKVNNRIWIKVI